MRPLFGMFVFGLVLGACAAESSSEVDHEQGESAIGRASDVLYDDRVLRDFGLELTDGAIAVLNQSPEINVDRPSVDGVFIHAGVRYDVEVKLKGQLGSFRRFDRKPGLKLKFKPQHGSPVEFMGVTSLTLNNLVQDRSMLAEVTAWDLFRAVGLPTPRASFVRLTINGQPYGVYVNAETVGKAFLERNGLDKRGPLFEPLYSGFVLDEGDASAWTRLAQLRNAIDTKDADEFFFGPAAPFDVDKLTTYFAAEVVTDAVDGYLDAHNNFRYHVDPATDRWTIIPGTPDRSFERDVGPFETRAGLAKKCLASDRCRLAFRTKLDGVAATLAASLNTFDAREALIKDAAAADPRKEQSNADRAAARDRQRTMIRKAVERLASKLSGTRVDVDGRTYRFFTSGASFPIAAALCREGGGSISLFDTDAQRVRVHAKALELFQRTYWVGATDRHSEGTWIWETNHAPIAFPLPWRTNEPNGGLRESCAEAAATADGKWNDLDCETPRPFLCSP